MKMDFATNFLYKHSIEEEKNDRKLLEYKYDFQIADKMIMEIRDLGYDVTYATDLSMGKFNDKRIIPIYKKYYSEFNNIGFAEDFIGLIAVKGYKEAIPIIADLYERLKHEYPLVQIASCDNAFVRIKDKGSILLFLNYLYNENDFIRLPLTMCQLAKWQVPEAKGYFYKYLSIQNRDGLFTAIECLSYYQDVDGTSEIAIREKINSTDKDISMCAKKALKRLKHMKISESHALFETTEKVDKNE